MPTMTIPSATMRRLKAAAAAARSSPTATLHRHSAGDQIGDASGARRMHGTAARAAQEYSSSSSGERRATVPAPAGGRVQTPPPSPLRPPCASAAAAAAVDGDAKVVRIGERVLVRTAIGERVLSLSAVVVSAVDQDGYLDVAYDGVFPRDDPFAAAVRVARDQIVTMDTPPTVAAPSSAPGAENSPLVQKN
ncbi:hypothetical protein ACP4OV_029565 [Aristida adscensionis]